MIVDDMTNAVAKYRLAKVKYAQSGWQDVKARVAMIEAESDMFRMHGLGAPIDQDPRAEALQAAA